MAKINVDTRKLVNDMNTVNCNIQKIEKEITEMKYRKNELKRVWIGRTAENFDNSMEHTLMRLSGIKKVYTDSYDQIMDVCQQYEKCEQEVVNVIHSMRW